MRIWQEVAPRISEIVQLHTEHITPGKSSIKIIKIDYNYYFQHFRLLDQSPFKEINDKNGSYQ